MTDEEREHGKIMAPMAHTSVGRKRLDNIHRCIATVVEEGVPGDLIETGVWRGGAAIFMRGALNAYGAADKIVWAADSFEGLPPPDPKHSKDAGAKWHTRPELAVSLEQVQDHFRRYDLLDGVQFLKGWFKDTLPGAPFEKLALARLDGDMYGSTMDALTALYERVSPGGFLIIDDYHGVPACAAAVEDFRKDRGITDTIEQIDWTGAFWRKSG
jgi:O-methyltransferase